MFEFGLRAAVAGVCLSVFAGAALAEAEPASPSDASQQAEAVDTSSEPIQGSRTSGDPADAPAVHDTEAAGTSQSNIPEAESASKKNAVGPQPVSGSPADEATKAAAPVDPAPSTTGQSDSSGEAAAANPPMGVAPQAAQDGESEAAPAREPAAKSAAVRRPEDITLTVATWESAYNAAQKQALFTPFQTDTKYNLKIVSHGGDMESITAARVQQAGWDLIELDAQTAHRGCDSGWLTPIDAGSLPESVEGDPAQTDYLPGALLPCAVGSAAWSAVVVYDQRAGFATPPNRVSDLFDLARLPGKRALPRQAPYTLELALMADGVPPAQVYDLLATPAGQDRAFDRLSSIRHAIVWWDNAADALKPFAGGTPEGIYDVVMGIAFNGRVFTQAVRAQQTLRILWDGQIYQFNYWAVPAAAQNTDAVYELLRYVSMPERQARQTSWFPYGPLRKSALPLVGQHAEIDIDMADFVPTMPRNWTQALRFDQAWWAENGEALKARFANWLDLPTPRVPADQLVPPTPVKALRAHAMTIR